MSTSKTMPDERIRIFDREGFPIAEFRASVERSLSLGAEGRAEFTYASRKTDIVNEKVLNYGNWLLVESTALPAWVGVIDPPRTWSPRTVTISAYTPERVFGWRRGPLERVLTGSGGSIFEQLLTLVNQAEGTVIRAGNIWRGGTQRQETVNPKPLSEYLQTIQERTGEEYAWRHAIDSNGRLIVYADWFQKAGTITSVLLHEGKSGGNIETLPNVMTEDGEIYNDIIAYIPGMSWQSNATEFEVNEAGIGRYGLRQIAKEYPGETSELALHYNALEELARTADAAKTFHVNALNVGDTFDYIRLGNTMRIQFENIGFTSNGQGFETNVRIMGMTINSAEKNKVELVLEEVINV